MSDCLVHAECVKEKTVEGQGDAYLVRSVPISLPSALRTKETIILEIYEKFTKSDTRKERMNECLLVGISAQLAVVTMVTMSAYQHSWLW